MRQHAAPGSGIILNLSDNAVNGAEHTRGSGSPRHRSPLTLITASPAPKKALRRFARRYRTSSRVFAANGSCARNTDGGIGLITGIFAAVDIRSALEQISLLPPPLPEVRPLRVNAMSSDGVFPYIAQHVFTQFDAPVFNPVIGHVVDVVLNQARHAVLFFIGNHRIAADIRQSVGFRQYLFCRHAPANLPRQPRPAHPPNAVRLLLPVPLYILNWINIAEQCGL